MSKAAELAEFGSGISSGPNAVEGLAKAYIRRDFNNNVTDSSLNIASVTDNALGDQTMNISSAMSAATYSMVGMASRKANSLDFHVVMIHDSADPTTTAYRLRCSNLSGSDKDPEFVSTSVDGGLA